MNVLRFPGPRERQPSPELDAEARERIRASLDESLLVEAAAGTGKTTVLIERLVAMLVSGRARVETVVAVTFTRKAAGELKLRLRQELETARARTEGEEQARVERSIAHLEQARIGTIHSFCAELLRERPVEACVDPGFEEVADDESPKIYRQAFDRYIQEQLEQMPPGIRRALSRLALQPAWGEGSPIDRLREAGLRLIEWRDFPKAWRREPIDREGAIDVLAEWTRRLAGWSERCANTYDELRRSLDQVRLLWTWIDRREADPPRGAGLARDYDALEARFLELRTELRRPWNRRKGSGKFAEALPREQVVDARDKLVEQLDEFRRVADADLAALLQGELAGATARYEERKRSLGKLDFQDLLIKARDLLRDHRRVRADFQRRFSHLFVDEFQDTDPLQAEILLLLAAEDPETDDWLESTPAPGKLFLVGDPKQSIYRFRRADVDLYRRVKEGLVDRGVAVVRLTQSFRATAPIQRFVNRAFAPEMDGDARRGSPEYIPLEEHREAIPGQPPVVALPVPRPFGVRQLSGKAIDESLPDAAAAWIHWLLEESGWRVCDPETRELVPVESRHVCLLFRRYLSWRTDVTRAYTRALEARGIAHLLIGARTFHQREEVETLRAALHAIEWPDDELAVFATLRGALFAFSDDLLLRFSRRCGLHPLRWRERQAAEEPSAEEPSDDARELGETLDALARLHRRRNDRAIVESLQELLELTRAHAGFALRPAGHQVLGNVERVLDLARRFELSGGRSFRGFVEQLEEEAAKPNSSEAPLVEEGADGVRLMTVHTAKGLEYPVVVLADMTAQIARREPEMALDAESGLCAIKLLGCAPHELLDRADLELERDRAEGARVAYVAATRARDLLVVPAVGDGAWEGWLSPLNRALYPATEDWRRSHPVEGCPRFGESSVLERPMHYDGDVEGSVKPGLHGFAEAGYQVVWWDPRVLRLGVEEAQGLRHEEILAPAGDAALDSRHDYEEWRARESRVREAGREPSLRVITVSELDETPPGRIAVEVVECPGSRERPTGKRFGALVHRALEVVALSAGRAEIERVVELQARLLDASGEERGAAVEAVSAALASEICAAARAGAEVRREAPFTLVHDDGRLIEGTIDLLYRAGPQAPWVVVDFKTEPDVEHWQPTWRRQVGWYAHAVERLLGGEARGVVLAV
ncbi:MAG TPA: UvrD-helicase domain-containing protein [Thermoanaerobaculia bacterium]|nr:UvrD-helicase domain-containing protein [Thermoanaerobaculia bacterium]